MTQEIDIPAQPSLMEQLLAQHEQLVEVPKTGDIVTGHILDKSRNAMYLDLGNLGVGVIYGRELFDDMDTFKSAKIGDPIQATIQEFENEDGYVELSLRSASRERSWEELRRKMEAGDIFNTEVLDANKGGLIVRVNGVMGFLPVSQLAPDHYPRVEGGNKNQILDRLKSYTGESFKVKVITAAQDEDKLIVSEKAAVGDEMSELLQNLKVGSIVEGSVSGVVDFGVFIKFQEQGNDLEGLVHISELAWQRIDNPSDFVQVGEKVKAKVIGVDGLRISLSVKQLKEDPWKNVAEKYKLGDKVTGEVLKVTAFGGFVKLDEDIHGLVHISELPEEAQSNPTSVLKTGERQEFKIISLEPDEHRLGLSLREDSTPKTKVTKKSSKTDEEPKAIKKKPAKKSKKKDEVLSE
jgi:small subunit ribosomal protein S1